MTDGLYAITLGNMNNGFSPLAADNKFIFKIYQKGFLVKYHYVNTPAVYQKIQVTNLPLFYNT